MHELAITESVVDLVRDRTGGRRVVAVQLCVGALSGFVPASMQLCFEIATTGTPLQGARLDFTEPPGRISCRVCGTEHDIPDAVLLCPCGSADVVVVSGDELRVVSVELERETTCV
ncbi:MAG TPA: hydrogenase maturation nickel metallochaperone HypA [Nocardioides sp.]|jgi:hydrogenase nickel incorporation protein HypA/HybF|nr:hydrogenase maturation nickel metallochaperone HypA [Nocardioides sp.]